MLNTYIRQLNEALRAAAAAESLALFDVERMLDPLTANPKSYLEEDNLHLNPAIGIEVLRVMLTSVAAAFECASECASSTPRASIATGRGGRRRKSSPLTVATAGFARRRSGEERAGR